MLEDVDLSEIALSVREAYPSMVEELFSKEARKILSRQCSDDDSFPSFVLQKTKGRIMDIYRHTSVDLCPFKVTHLLKGLCLNALVAQTTEFIGVVEKDLAFQQQDYEGGYERK